MAIINSSASKDGFVRSYLQNNWPDLRKMHASGHSFDSDNARDDDAVSLFKDVGMRGTVFGMFRAFFNFDTSGVTVEPESATLNIRGHSQNDFDVIAVKADYMPSLDKNDIGAILGAEAKFNASDGAGTGSLVGGDIVLSEKFTSWDASGWNTADITVFGLEFMVDEDDFQLCLMEYDHDFLDIEPTTSEQNGLYWGDGAYPPYIEYTPGVAVAADNATFFGANF